MNPSDLDRHVQLIPDFLPNRDRLLQALVATTHWDDRLRARKTASYGLPYNYSGITYPATPFPDTLQPIVTIVDERLGYPSNSCLLNYYPTPKHDLGFHSDSVVGLHPDSMIAVLSLGTMRSLVFRSELDRNLKLSIDLLPGSLLTMTLEMQSSWKHALPPGTRDGPRISLTFRRFLPDASSQ